MSDLIDRQAAIDAVRRTPYHDLIKENMVLLLMDLPSAEPKRKTGIWMGSVCSECGNSTSFYYDCDYCPKCGARMNEK